MDLDDLRRQVLVVMRETRLLADMLGIPKGNTSPEPQNSPVIDDLPLKVYQAYPKKVGKKKGLQKLKKIIKSSDDFNMVMRCLSHYLEYLEENETSLQFTKQFDVWVNNYEDWIDPPATQARIDQQKKEQARQERKLQLELERRQRIEEEKQAKDSVIDMSKIKEDLRKKGIKL